MLARLLPVGVMTLLSLAPVHALADPATPKDQPVEQPEVFVDEPMLGVPRSGPSPEGWRTLLQPSRREWTLSRPHGWAWDRGLGVIGSFAVGAYTEGSSADARPRHLSADDPQRSGFLISRLELGGKWAASGPRSSHLEALVFAGLANGAQWVVDEARLGALMSWGADLQLDVGVLRAQLGWQNDQHEVQQWLSRRPALASAILGRNPLVAPGARVTTMVGLPAQGFVSASAELLTVDRVEDRTAGIQTFGGGGAESATGVFALRGGVGDTWRADVGASYAIGRAYFPDPTTLCSIENTSLACPTARSHVAGGYVALGWRPTEFHEGAHQLIRLVVESLARRVPTYGLTEGALYVELDATLLPRSQYHRGRWIEAALRLDLVGTPGDDTLLRKSQLVSGALTWYPTEWVRLRLYGQYDHKPQALKAPTPPAPPEQDSVAVFLQTEFYLGDLGWHFWGNH